MNVDQPRFVRLLGRCEELALDPNADRSVKRVYNDILADDSAAYLAAYQALGDAEKAAKKEGDEGVKALNDIGPPYLKARSVLEKYVKDVAIPEPLKSLPTDTDRKNAIGSLLRIIDDHDETNDWAKELMTSVPGEPRAFGELAPEAIREITEWIAANVVLSKAVRKRAEAFGPAYEAYLDFKDVVRNTYGPKSIQYRRIHLRKNGKLAVDDVET